MDYWHLTRCMAIAWLILQHLGWSLTVQNGSPTTGEYCVRESFEPTCAENHVISLQYAKYGRMKLGECITRDLGSMGCYSDVLTLADRECSGRRHCSILIPYPPFEVLNPCNSREFVNYLEVSYTCLPVIASTRFTCSSEGSIPISSPSSAYLASQTTEETGCGDAEHPWMLTSDPGQSIIISLLDFASSQGNHLQTGTCTVYVVIKEPTAQTTKTVCGGREKERVVYQSMGSTVEVQVRASSDKYFLLHYEFTGCRDPAPVAGVTFTRDGSVGRWRCRDADVEWMVRCEGTSWVGQPRDCRVSNTPHSTTSPKPDVPQNDVTAPVTAFSWKMVLIMVGIVTVGMVACVLIIAIVCLKRSRTRAGAPLPPHMSHPLYEVYDLPAPRRVSERDVPQAYYQSLPKDYHSKKTYTDNTLAPDGRYDKPVWERPLPRPPGKGDFDA